MAELIHRGSQEKLHFSQPRAKYGVIIPYSSNVDFRNGKPEFRLSKYSAFITDVAKAMLTSGFIENALLCGEQTFGRNNPVTTTTLMRDRLTQGDSSIDSSQVASIAGKNLNSTPFQIRAIKGFKEKNHLQDSDFLLIDLSFHDERIKDYLGGYHMDIPTISADTVSHIFTPDLPLPSIPELYLQRERKLRLLADTVDPKGWIPYALTLTRGRLAQDGMILDVTTDGELEKIRGSVKLRRGTRY